MITYIKSIVEYLEEVVKEITFRHTKIKNAIEWRKFLEEHNMNDNVELVKQNDFGFCLCLQVQKHLEYRSNILNYRVVQKYHQHIITPVSSSHWWYDKAVHQK